MAKKAYASVDEWLGEIEGFGTRYERMLEDCSLNEAEKWVREAWKQATRTARVQEIILLGEMRKLRESLQEMENKYEGVWAVLAGEDE